MRTFISLKLNKEAIEEIKRIQKYLKNSALFEGKLTEEENLHLTLKFLGELDENKVEEIRRRLREIKLKSFKAKLGGVGVFSKEFVRIIWVKLNNCDELQREVDKVLKSLFTQEKRFMSHLTIARVKKVSDKKKLFGFLDRIKVKEIVFEVKSFELMKSELFPKGPKYDVIGKFALL